jgi:uncharacterized UBP type Zn finger protein
MSAPEPKARCGHFVDVEPVTPRADACEECRALGERWNELRVCLTCGHVGCCEDSKHAHALRHFQATGHPLIASLERGESWSWCYVHRQYFDVDPAWLPKRRSPLASLFGRLVGR